ncbi:hypothetical protein BKA61DRAFT_220734 [Leptodontidium sp. MPI-SDFR-AT-0119]|nr:hypothetical protein BKA61DRAFT_220734 [Leptodontidium sp. MPI-SDFR-AT-0119]
MDPSNSTATCQIEPNSDIMGIGVRVSTYVLSLGMPLASHLVRSKSLIKSMDTAMGVMGLGILITAIIFQSQGRLDLFHGICVFNLVSLVGFAIQPKTGKEVKDHKFKDLLYFAGYLLFLAYSIQLFATAPTFGSSPDCNDTVVLVILGVKFPATQVVLRWMIVVMLTLLAGSVAVAWFLSPTFYGSTSGPNWPVAIEELAARAYLVSNLELTIRYNNVAEGLGEWSFGQIMAMVLLLGPLVDFLTGLIYPESVEEPDYYSSSGTNKYIKKISKIFCNRSSPST